MAETSSINGLQAAPAASDLPKSAISRKPRNPAGRRSNKDMGRKRKHLTPQEVEKLRAAAKETRNPARDECLVLVAATHGLRVSELVGLDWSQIDLGAKRLDVERVKGSESNAHPLMPEELKLLAKLHKESSGKGPVFLSERRGPLSVAAVQKLVANLGQAAGLPWRVHPHMLRHAAGYRLVNQSMPLALLQQWLGHVSVRHTIEYAKLSPNAFSDWFSKQPKPRRHK